MDFLEPTHLIIAYVCIAFIYIGYDIKNTDRVDLVEKNLDKQVGLVEIDFDTFDKEVALGPDTVQARLRLNPNKEYDEVLKRAEGELLTYTLLEDSVGAVASDGKEFTAMFEGVIIWVKGYELQVA